jgi:lipopolysaccharide export system permease protein
MLALGRLYHESEMAAIQSGGVGPAGLYRPIAMLGVLIAALLTWLSLFALPQASARAQQIRVEALREAQFGSLEAGRFRTFGGGEIVFYAERVDDNGVLHNVHVFVDRDEQKGEQKGAQQDADKRLEIWVATRAEQRGAGQPDQTFVLYDGDRYEGVPGQGQFRIIHFSEGGIPIRLGALNTGKAKAELKSSAELLQSAAPTDQAELAWRISVPVMSLILMLIAVPLSRLRPRQGRFGRIGVAILAFFFYWQLLLAARTWVEAGILPGMVGVLWVHAVALCGALWLLARQSPFTRAPRLIARST